MHHCIGGLDDVADSQIPQQRRVECTTAVIESPAQFIVLEGLSAVGKSTVAPLLAEELGATLVQTLLPSFDDVRVHIDRSRLVMARLHFWMMCNYAVSDLVRETLAQGRDVVVESYFYRTLATHAAMGATHLPPVDWDRAVRPELTVLLTVNESQRQRRLAERELSGGLSYWSRLEESNIEVTRQTYESFGLTTLDTTGLGYTEVATRLARLAGTAEARRG
jgi:thymidylate kinase